MNARMKVICMMVILAGGSTVEQGGSVTMLAEGHWRGGDVSDRLYCSVDKTSLTSSTMGTCYDYVFVLL